MAKPKTEEEISLMRENAILVSKTLAEVGKAVAPGVTTKELNRIAEAFIRDHGRFRVLRLRGLPCGMLYVGKRCCCARFSGRHPLKEGDIVSVDITTLYKGYSGDSAYTSPVGEVSAETRRLLDVTKASLYKGMRRP